MSVQDYADWIFRYQYMYPRRYTNKQKRRFVQALYADLKMMGADVSTGHYTVSERDVRGYIAVGKPAKARKIIVAAFNTPPAVPGSYVYFDPEKEKRQATTAIAAEIIAWAVLCGLLIFSYLKFQTRIGFWLWLLLFTLMFLLAVMIRNQTLPTSGLVRSTSSILTLLGLVSDGCSSDTAYLFVDDPGDGLWKKNIRMNPRARIIITGSLGADAPLQTRTDGKETFMFRADKKDDSYVLTSSKLHARKVDPALLEEAARQILCQTA